MSWYKRKPRIKEPIKHCTHRHSAASQKYMDETKEKVREKPKEYKKPLPSN